MMNFGSLNLWNSAAGAGESDFLRMDFYKDSLLPDGFTFTGTESYNDGGLEFDGSEKLNSTVDGTEPWFNQGESGYMLVRYLSNNTTGTDQYLVDFHDGTSSRPSIAMRQYRTDNRLRAACYDDGSASMTNTNGMFIYNDTFAVFGLSWDGSDITIGNDNGSRTDPLDTSLLTFSDLTIGDDHNGGQELEGVIARVEVGKGSLTYKQMLAKMKIVGDRIIEVFGQSQATQLFNSTNGGLDSRIGHASILKEFQKYIDQPNIVFVLNSGTTGSALCKSSSASDSWVDNTVSPFVDEIRLTESQAVSDDRGQVPELGFLWQYQGDVADISAGATTISDYGDAIEHIKDKKVADYGSDYKMVLIINGGRNEAVTDAYDEAVQAVREKYLEKIAAGGAYKRGPEVYDLGTADATGHLTNPENGIAGTRIGRNAAYHMGLGVANYLMPNSVKRSDFVGGTGWAKDGFTFTGTAATGFITANNATIETGETYEVTYTLEDDYGAGSVRVLLYDSSTVAVGATRSGAGTYTEELTVSAGTGTSGTYATIQVQSAFTGTIDASKISIRKKAEASTVGPAASTFTNNAGQTVIDVTHDKGTDFNAQPAGGYEGFAVFDTDGTRLAVTNVTKVDSNSLKIKHAAPSGISVSVKYPYGALEGVTLGNTVKDNSPELMPLQTFVQTGIAVGAALGKFTIADATYASKSFDASAQGGNITGIKLNPDGNKLYVANTNDDIYQYTLSTAYDISTASYDSKLKDVSAQVNNPYDVEFSDDGIKMFVAEGVNKVFEYTLSTAWDVSTATYVDSYTSTEVTGGGGGLAFSSGGTKMYMGSWYDDTVFQYTLSTAWDVSTASYDSKSLDISTQATNAKAIKVSDDGNFLVVLNSTGIAYEYALSTAYDISTGAYTSESLDVTAQRSDGYALDISESGQTAYVSGLTDGIIYQYSL